MNLFFATPTIARREDIMRAFIRRTWTLAAASGLLAGLSQMAIAQEVPTKDATAPTPSAEVAPADAQALPGGMRVATQTVRVTAPASGPREAGKTSFPIDSATGEMLVPTARFYLPSNWNWGRGTDQAVDSVGRPIISAPLGWSGWTQSDVDALRATIAQHLALAGQRGGQSDGEADAVLGNFIGQALVRGVDISDVVDLTQSPVVTPGVASSAIERMHAYEQARHEQSMATGITYQPTVYAATVEAFLNAHGASLADVLAIEEPVADGGDTRATPSGCYFRQPGQGLGLNLLVDATTIWEGDDTDDAQADVPIGFPCNFYKCEDADLNTSVRVSSNGYVSFFQQGGGATNGTNWINEAIASVNAPNGMVAGFWDDLQIMPNQSTIVDKVSWKIEGSIGHRTLTVEYLSVSRRGGDTTDYHTFQILIQERRDDAVGRSLVTIAYPDPSVSLWLADSIDEATVGLENFAGTSGECLPTCALLTDIPARNYIFVPMNNDRCDDAISLSPGYEQTGDLRFAYNDTTACDFSNPDQWWYFTAPCNGTLRVDTCGTHDTGGIDQGLDTVLSAHTECPGGLGITLACADDTATDCGDQGIVRDAKIELSVNAGQTTYFRVTSFSFPTTNGFYRINTTFTGQQAPANDNCAGATAISAPASASGNVMCASSDGDNDCGASDGNPDVWYRYHAQLAGSLRVTSCGTHDSLGVDQGMDTVLSLHSGCPGSESNMLDCNDDNYAGTCGISDLSIPYDSRVIGSVGANDNVLIRVSHFADSIANGAFQIQTFFLTADLDADCDVDLQDLAFLLSHFGQSGANIRGDIDGDDSVTLQDLAFLLSNFGFTCP
jgi:hypothetical protein